MAERGEETLNDVLKANKTLLKRNKWWRFLKRQKGKGYWAKILKILSDEKSSVYPPTKLRFKAFEITPLKSIKVVILGMDPYFNPGLAMGLSFSVPNNKPTPPSLMNIFRELENDTGIKRTKTDLTDWANQGVFLINCALTVRQRVAGSHLHLWRRFSKRLIKYINKKCENVVYILWGGDAKAFSEYVDIDKNLILTSSHPSGRSAYISFFGSKPFSRTNKYLKQHGKLEIKWG